MEASRIANGVRGMAFSPEGLDPDGRLRENSLPPVTVDEPGAEHA